jgi:hypothetical protein
MEIKKEWMNSPGKFARIEAQLALVEIKSNTMQDFQEPDKEIVSMVEGCVSSESLSCQTPIKLKVELNDRTIVDD